MNSQITHFGKTTAAVLPFEVASSQAAKAGDNFGAELDRASSPRSFSNQSTEKIMHRKATQPRMAKNNGVKHHLNPRPENSPRSVAGQNNSRTFHADTHDSPATETCLKKPSTSTITQPAEEQEYNSLAGALAVQGVAKPVDAASVPKVDMSSGENGDAGENVSAEIPQAGPDTAADAETAPGLSLTGDAIAAVAEENEMKTGQTLPADFDYLRTPEAAPTLPVEMLPVSDSKMISVPAATQKQIEIESQMDATASTSVSPDSNATELSTTPPSSAEAATTPTTGVLTPPLSDGRPARAARRAEDVRAQNAHGISAAKLAATMKNTTNKEGLAGSGRQELPGGNISAARVVPHSALNGTTKDPVSELMFAAGNGVTAKILDGRGEGIVVSDLARFEPARMERIGEIISREVRMFKRAADDQLDVVLTPDAKTQISLRLQWRDGQVEVQAKCELGDHHALSLQWAQLQTSLAQQGVRLAALTERTSTGFTEFFNPSSFSQSHNGQSRGGDAEAGGGQRQATPASPVPSLASAPGVRPGFSRKAAPTNDRFETWA